MANKGGNRIVETGATCPHCGRPMKAICIPALRLQIPIQCECVTRRQKADEVRFKADQRERYLHRIAAECGMPKRERGYGFDNFRPRPGTEKALRWCREYADQFERIRTTGKGLFLFGSTGSGKTHLACAVGNQLLAAGIPVVYWSVPALYRKIKASFGRDSSCSEEDVLEPCLTAALLILDDVGAEKPSEWTASTAYSIINDRSDNLRPTILTSNAPMDELETGKVLDGRTISRIAEACTMVKVAATDFRREKH